MTRSILPGILFLCLLTSAFSADCPIVPQPKEYQAGSRMLNLGTAQTAAIVVADRASEQELYAAQRLQVHIQRRFKQTFPILTADKLTPAVSQVFVLSVKEDKKKFNGFTIDFSIEGGRDRIAIQGADKGGLIYGAEAVFNLIAKNKDGVAKITVAKVNDWPSIPWRGRPHSVMAQQIEPGQLDAYIHGRINFADYRDDPRVKESLIMPARKSSMGCPPGQPIDEALARKVIGEYHKRAMFVYGTVSCTLPEGDYAKLTETFDALLKLGCDGIWVSMDDTGGGKDPVKLAEYAAEYMRKSGMTGHKSAFTPSAAEYTTIDRPLNRAMGRIGTFNEAVWIFTRVPCKADYAMAKEIGLKNKTAWWFNYCETTYPDPKAGFIHSSAVLTTQRKDGRPSYMNLLPITPGWGSPQFDKIRDAAQYVDHINLWALCGGWPSEYAIVMFGQWGWNPEGCDWPKLRDSIYDYVWGPSQVATIREFDETWVQLKDLYWLPLKGFRTPDNGLVRLKSRENRSAALKLLNKLDKLAAVLAEKSPEETALDLERFRYEFMDPLQTSLRFARKQATLEYPEYEFGQFESKSLEILNARNAARKNSHSSGAESGMDAANKYLADVRAKVPPMLETLGRELAELKDIEPVLNVWRARLAKGKTVAEIEKSRTREMKAQWNRWVRQPVKEFLPFLDEPQETNLTAIFANANKPAPSGMIKTYEPADWSCTPALAKGVYHVGQYDRQGQKAAAIMVPRRARSAVGDFGIVELTAPTPKCDAGQKLFGELFIGDTRIDHAYRNVRRIDVLVNGKVVFGRDIADPKAKDWVTFELTDIAQTAPELKIQVRVTEKRATSDHTSWVFVGSLRIFVVKP
ncbi:MAG: glycoside hydrolase family 20 zincin-like fold domain-containing protein [Verrucomicrobiia bacterium]